MNIPDAHIPAVKTLIELVTHNCDDLLTPEEEDALEALREVVGPCDCGLESCPASEP